MHHIRYHSVICFLFFWRMLKLSPYWVLMGHQVRFLSKCFIVHNSSAVAVLDDGVVSSVFVCQYLSGCLCCVCMCIRGQIVQMLMMGR